MPFIATEFSTGAKHGGMIDTLGVCENNCPVIIQYRRSTNKNFVNQGHHGIGELEVRIKTKEDIEKAKQYIIKSYEIS